MYDVLQKELELYFQGYEKAYSFQGMLAERKWASTIEKAYKAASAELKKAEKAKKNAVEVFAPLLFVYQITMF